MRATRAVVLALGSTSAFAQQAGSPAVMALDTPKSTIAQPPPRPSDTVDQVVVRQLLIGNDSEVGLGKLAGSKGQSKAVKDFAKHMVDPLASHP